MLAANNKSCNLLYLFQNKKEYYTLLIFQYWNNDKVLITERHLNTRSGEHLSLSALTCKRVNNNKKLAVKDQCLFLNHVGSFEDFSILMYESNPFKLLIKEALLVSTDKPLLNNQLNQLKVKSIHLQLF